MKKTKYLLTVGVVYFTIIFGFTFFDGFRLLGGFLNMIGIESTVEMPINSLPTSGDPLPPPPPPDGISG